MGKIVHGNRNFGYAPINVSGGVSTFGAPVMLPGMYSSSIEVEQSTTSVYADDKDYCRVKGAKVRNAEVVLRYISEEYAQYLGYKLNENGMLTDTGSFPAHCIFFEETEEDCETGETTQTLHYLYNVQASTPTKETTSDEEEISPAEISVEYSCKDSDFVVDDDGDPCQYGYLTRTEENKAVYDTFKTTVLLPTTEI